MGTVFLQKNIMWVEIFLHVIGIGAILTFKTLQAERRVILLCQTKIKYDLSCTKYWTKVQ